MKNIAVLLRKEGKEGTKLFNDVEQHDVPRGRVNLDKLEVSELNDAQRRQFKSMKFKGPGVQDAVNSALSGKATEAKAKGRTAGRSQERHTR